MLGRSPEPESHYDCAAIRALVDDVVAGEADALSVARVEAHASTCSGCRFAMAQARAYRRAMRRVGRSERAPGELRQRALDLLHETREPRGPRP